MMEYYNIFECIKVKKKKKREKLIVKKFDNTQMDDADIFKKRDGHFGPSS